MGIWSTFDREGGSGFPSISEASGGYYDIDLEYDTYVISAEYTWNNLMLVSEYTWSDREVIIDMVYTYPTEPVEVPGMGLIDLTEFSMGTMPVLNKSDGWYAGATYRFADWFELGGYYSEFYPDRHNRDGKAVAFFGGGAPEGAPEGAEMQGNPTDRYYNKDICLTARFDINPYWSVKLEGHKIKGTALLPLGENVDDNNQTTFVEDWKMFAIKTTYSF